MSDNSTSKTDTVSFSFRNIFKDAWRNYKKIPDGDKKTVNTLLAFLLLLIGVGVSFVHWLPNNAAAIVITSVLSSIAVSVIFAVFDQVSLLTPVHKRLNNSIRDLKQSLLDLHDESKVRADRNEQLVSNFIGLVEKMDKYNDVSIARQFFGFDAIEGLRYVRSGRHHELKRTDFISKILGSAKKGDEVLYLTSFVDNETAFIDALHTATSAGAHVRLMVMMPSVEAEVVRARWQDFFGNDNKTCEEFVAYIRPRADRIYGLCARLKKASENGDIFGSFDVRFFSRSLNFPLVVVTRKGKRGGAADEHAYTGFYANRNAEDMPYVVWHGGMFGIVSKLKNMFEKKWEKDGASELPGRHSIVH